MKWCNLLVMAAMGAIAVEAASAAETASSAKSAVPVVIEKSAPKPVAPPTRAAADRLDLDASVVTGNRELPKVLYIVPWKKAELGDLPEQPFNSLLDEALAPIDRDEFRREVSYYSKLVERPVPVGAVQPDVAPAAPVAR